ncbi:hypothetical protein C7964_1129 [Loktanella sp. PT4BL]|uniref:hypothetical protein n=1 Tax=Loktanella sp. PT4BL TaxID=2135611 RepID=UPI000D7626F1|nr:hypothetical protein [Loktanella sp. PT4BL]PXW66162.1 hypothetical protein C7964_1129 [Loktanella sp. PT4BL]
MTNGWKSGLRSLPRKFLGDVRTEQVKRLLAVLNEGRWQCMFSTSHTNAACSLSEFSIRGRDVFFGYYDKRQLSLDGKRLLACSVTSSLNKQHEPQGVMDVGWFSVDGGGFKTLGATKAFNWQQGCMLRWVPNTEDQSITFNDFLEGRFVSVLKDAGTGQTIRIRPYPSYDCSPDGKMVATCDFSRLHHCRLGYGYWQEGSNSTRAHPESNRDQLLVVYDAKTDAKLHQVTIGDAEKILGSFDDLEHVYINHLHFSSGSKNLVFLLFWRSGTQDKMATLVLDLDTSKLKLVTRMYMSHFCWETDASLVAWAENKIGHQAYFRFDVDSGEQTEYWDEPSLSDGHCSIARNGTMLSDTYPDTAGFQSLFIKRPGASACQLASFKNPARFISDLRCDLHPRLSSLPDSFTFDSAHSGHRRTYLLRTNV